MFYYVFCDPVLNFIILCNFTRNPLNYEWLPSKFDFIFKIFLLVGAYRNFGLSLKI